MLGSGHLISGLDVATGTFALMVFSAGAAAIVVAILVRIALRRAGVAGTAGFLSVLALAFVGTAVSYVLFDRLAARDLVAERRAIESRAAELTARSLAPGSALGCLDAVANALVENSCEKPLFSSPEAIAAAVAYVDARFSLFAVSASLAEQDKGYRPAFERLRQGLEADRYGLVAHVLATRGCSGADCAELKLLRDPSRVVANMKARTFEAALGVHALSWVPGAGGVASLASASSVPFAGAGTGPGAPVAPGAAPAAGGSRFDFPSASSIPPVSIMSAEPAAPHAPAEPRAAVLPPKRPERPAAAAPAARPQGARQAAAPANSPQSPGPPPSQLAAPPAQAAPEDAVADVPDPHARR